MHKTLSATMVLAALVGVPSLASAQALEGAAAGAITGGIVGGPVGAAVGAAVGGTVGASTEGRDEVIVERERPTVTRKTCVDDGETKECVEERR